MSGLMHNTIIQRSLKFQQGLNLIELIVAMAIGIFLVFGATQVYVKSRASYETNEAIARLQETARFGMNALEQDIRLAGYWGLYPVQSEGNGHIDGGISQVSAVSAIASSANAIQCGNNFAVDLGTSIQGDNNGRLPNSQGGGLGFLSSTRATCLPFNNRRVTSADTLTIRRADASTTLSKTLVICSQVSMYGTVDNNSANCPAGTQINDLLVHAYYVDQDSTQLVGLPSLRRKELTAGPGFNDVEIIPGVEDMQIQFGIQPVISNNSANNGQVQQYVDPDSALLNSATMQIVTVRVWLLVRSETTESGFTDNRTYVYGDRAVANGVTATLIGTAAAGLAYAPNDRYRRLLVSRTFQVRNIKAAPIPIP
jgi:type IV pilus assembly protein PilW